MHWLNLMLLRSFCMFSIFPYALFYFAENSDIYLLVFTYFFTYFFTFNLFTFVAPCRKYGCNLASCYVPNPNDCKSYLVCQRTALGTYVATRMRCAFGSYWTDSNIWTCERITDISKEKFNCPNGKKFLLKL